MSKIQKSKHKFYKFKKSTGKHILNVNMKGFLCSCNNREKDCIREAYNILNKYADVLYPPVVDTSRENKDEEECDIQEELKRELDDMKSKDTSVKRFQVVESGAKNFLFINTKLDDPVQLVKEIILDIDTRKSQQSKYLIRLIPIETTCKAYVDDIVTALKPLVDKYFKDKTNTFSVIYNHRNNNNLNRDEVIKAVAELVLQAGENKVDLKDPSVSVIVEVIKGIALLSVVPDFIKYKKYNLLALSGQVQETVQNKEQVECENKE